MAVKQLGSRASGPTDATTFADLATLAPNFLSTFTQVQATGGTNGQGGQSIPSGAFTRVQLAVVVSDVSSLWDTTNNWYTCPSAGIYEITFFLRPADGSTSAGNFGFGVYTSEADNPTFAWDTISTANNNTRRTTAVYIKKSAQAAGDKLRMFIYCDSFSSSIPAASMTIQRVG